MKSKSARIVFISITAYVIVAALIALAFSGMVPNILEFFRTFRMEL